VAITVSTAKYLFLAFALAMAALLLFSAARSAEATAFLIAPLLWAWVIGPALFAAACVRLSDRQPPAAWFLAVEAALVAWTGWSWYDLTFVHVHSTNAIGLAVSIPVMQYSAVGAAWLVALAAGWRRRPDWP
jgi:hypothetical protein